LANIPLSRNARPHIRFWLLFSFQGSAAAVSRRLVYNSIPRYFCQHLFDNFLIFFCKKKSAPKNPVRINNFLL
ncbi:hypothetical protein, partial [Phascolarctobacterium sp.]